MPQINAPSISKPVTFGLIALAVFLGGFLLWATLSPLATAAVAEGKVTVDSNNKAIQHLEGGIVKKLLVQEGNQVKAGQTLIELEKTQAQARLNLLKNQLHTLTALEARLKAERDNEQSIEFPAWLEKASKNDPDLAKVIKSQHALFLTRAQTLSSHIKILNQRVDQLKNEISSYQSQSKSFDEQLKLINEEIEAVAYLEKKKFIDRPRLLALQREASRLRGNRDEKNALAAKTAQRIGETKTQILHVQDSRLNEILEELRDTQKQLIETQEQTKAAEDILHRTVITAPRSGRVVNLNVHTVGGVITPGETILDIVPDKDELVIDAKVSPLDIDMVHPNLTAKIRFVSLKSRSTPVLEGKVNYVSADNIIDNATGQAYYLARIKIDSDELAKIEKLSMYPGMPVQVMIVTDTLTPLEYFIVPIKESFQAAFREQ